MNSFRVSNLFLLVFACVFSVFVGCGEGEERVAQPSSDIGELSGVSDTGSMLEAVPAAPGANTVTAFHLNTTPHIDQGSWTDAQRVTVDVADVPFTQVHFSAKVVPPFVDDDALISVSFPAGSVIHSVQVWANRRWTDVSTFGPSVHEVSLYASDLDDLVGDWETAHTRVHIQSFAPGDHTVTFTNSSGAGYTSEYTFRVAAVSAFLLNTDGAANGKWTDSLSVLSNVWATTVDQIHFQAKIVEPFVDAGSVITVTLPDGVAAPTPADKQVKVLVGGVWSDLTHSVSGQVISFDVDDLSSAVASQATARVKIISGMSVVPSSRTVTFSNSSGGHTSSCKYATFSTETSVTAFYLNRYDTFRSGHWRDWSISKVDTNSDLGEIQFVAKISGPFTGSGSNITATFPGGVTMPAAGDGAVKVWYNSQWNNYAYSVSGQTISFDAVGLPAVIPDYGTAVVKVVINLPGNCDVVLTHTGVNKSATYQFRPWR